MFKLNKNYLLIPILILGLSGCVERRVITIVNSDIRRATPTQQSVRRTAPRDRVVKEEILIKNSPSVVKRDIVLVPKNTPSLGIREGYIDRATLTRNRVTTSTSSRDRERVKSVNRGRVIERVPFPIEEYRVLQREGDSTVRGRVFLENSLNDERVIKKSLKLYLNPVTSYSKQWYEESYLNGYKMSKPDKRLYNYLKFTTTDESGAFSFFAVPDGDYYIGAKISCGSECGYDSSRVIRVVKRISVNDEVIEVDLMKVVP